MPDIAGQRHLVIERAKGYSSLLSKIYDDTRFLNSMFYLLGSGRGNIVLVPSEDIAYNKTYTAIKSVASGTFPSCITDHDDTTNCQWTSIPATTTDILSVDMGSTFTGALRVYLYDYNLANLNIYFYGSNDNSTWTQVVSVLALLSETKYDLLVYVSGYRYYKIATSYYSAGSNYYLSIYSFEAYPDTTLPVSRSFQNTRSRIIAYVYGSYYQLLEVIPSV
jgi:hypothetical protein